MDSKLDTSLLILALETLLEQLENTGEDTDGKWYKTTRVKEQITLLKNEQQ